MKFIDEKSIERLEFRNLLAKVEILSPYGKNKLKQINYFKKGEENLLEEEFNALEVFLDYYKNKKNIIDDLELNLHKLKDIKNLIKNCLQNVILDEVDLFEIKIQTFIMQKIRDILLENFSDITLKKFLLNDLSKIIKTLDPDDEKIPTFYIYESYSENLRTIRNNKKEIENQIFATKDSDKIKALKEKRLEFLVLEEKEEYEIRQNLSKIIHSKAAFFLENIEKISNLDFLMAKAKFARDYNGIRPTISKNNEFKLKGMVNLSVKEILKQRRKEYTPIDINLNQGVTIITGANMGGKTVALKTITENLLLFHMGFFVLGESATLSLVDFIFFISDDMQDISKGLSTFGAEIMKLKEVNSFLDTGAGFIVFDEFARGTNPREGQKFVKSLAKFLNEKSTVSVITTHFDGVVEKDMNHYQILGLKNVDFEALKNKIGITNKSAVSDKSMDLIQEYMDFRLEKSDNDIIPKDALNIAKLIGLDEKFTDIINEEYTKED